MSGKLSTKPYIPMLEENNAHQGFVDHGDFLKLKAKLPDYLQDPVPFPYHSGWRDLAEAMDKVTAHLESAGTESGVAEVKAKG